MRAAEAAEFERSGPPSPEAELPEIGSAEGTGAVYYVKRMSVLRPDSARNGPLRVPQGTHGCKLRTHRVLVPRCVPGRGYDVLALTLGSIGTSSGVFPVRVEFGTVAGVCTSSSLDLSCSPKADE